MVVHKTLKKVGRNVYGSGDTIVTKTSHFFQGLTLGAEGGGLYAVLYGINHQEVDWTLTQHSS